MSRLADIVAKSKGVIGEDMFRKISRAAAALDRIQKLLPAVEANLTKMKQDVAALEHNIYFGSSGTAHRNGHLRP